MMANRSFRQIFLSILAIAGLFFVGATSPSQAQDSPKKYVHIEIFSDQDAIIPGQEVTLAVRQNIADHWHTYWTNPGDSGLQTKLNWTLPDGARIGEVLWPTPERLPFGPLVNFGYEGQPTSIQTLFIPADYAQETLNLKLDVELLVCKDICIPETSSHVFTLPVSETSNQINQEIFDAANQALPKPGIVQASFEQEPEFLTLFFKDLPSPEQIYHLSFFPYDWGIIKNDTDQTLEISPDGQVSLLIDKGAPQLGSPIKGVLRAVYETGTRGFVVEATEGKKSIAPASASGIASSGAPGADLVNKKKESISILQALFFAFIGGLILNLMPCVFPILSMKALSLIKSRDNTDTKKARVHGLIYTAGVLVSFVVIAGALIFLKQTNDALGWGFQLQEPLFIGLLTYLFFLIGLNLSGYFEFGGSGFMTVGSKLSQKRGHSGSFFTGVLAVLVATPCTAPFMASALGVALVQPPIISLSIFIALGFGLAFPYLLLCFVPPLQKFLPKPGAWMDSFKQFLAFPIFATVIWLIWVYGQQTSFEAVFVLLAGLLMLALAVWIYTRAPKAGLGKFARHLFGLLSILLAMGVFASDIVLSVATVSDKPQTLSALEKPYSPMALEQALDTEDPVFVEMTAAWCITCQFNKRVAIKTPATQKAIADNRIVYFLGDWTNQDADITEYLKEFGRSGVPLYVYYGAPDVTGKRPDPKVLPQILTESIILEIFND